MIVVNLKEKCMFTQDIKLDLDNEYGEFIIKFGDAVEIRCFEEEMEQIVSQGGFLLQDLDIYRKGKSHGV